MTEMELLNQLFHPEKKWKEFHEGEWIHEVKNGKKHQYVLILEVHDFFYVARDEDYNVFTINSTNMDNYQREMPWDYFKEITKLDL